MNKLLALYLVFTFLFIAGCVSGQKNDEIPSGMGRINFDLTDAPYPYDSIERTDVRLEEVRLRSSDGQWTSPVSVKQDFNLLDLQNGIKAALGSIDVQPGTYNHLRMVVSSASVTLKDGRVFQLDVPSGAQSGIKIFMTPALEVSAGVQKNVLLDFDVSRSFIALGNAQKASGINGFIFKPVVRVGLTQDQSIVSGLVEASVCSGPLAPLENATITLSKDGAVIVVNASDTNGGYSFSALESGDYTLQVEAVNFVTQNYNFTKENEVSLELAGVVLTGCVDDSDTDADPAVSDGRVYGTIWSDLFTPNDQSDDVGLAFSSVELINDQGVSVAAVNSNNDGSYDFGVIASGDYKIRFTHEFHESAETFFNVDGDVELGITLRMLVDPSDF